MTTTTTTPQTADRTEWPNELSGYLTDIAREGERFMQAIEAGSLDAAIAPCPGWLARDLVQHLGQVHLWAAANVAFPQPKWIHVSDLSDLTPYWPEFTQRSPGDCDLVPWYRATLRNLLHVLAAASPEVNALSFLPAPSPLMMWARRQASEIAIHRFDAEQAAGIASSYDPTFAADMLDEVVSGFAPLVTRIAVTGQRVLLVDALDIAEQWWVTISPGRITTRREGADPDLTIAGNAADLYLTLWNRAPDTTVQLDGDRHLIDLWHKSCKVVWL